jgi:hypothetical protein
VNFISHNQKNVPNGGTSRVGISRHQPTHTSKRMSLVMGLLVCTLRRTSKRMSLQVGQEVGGVHSGGQLSYKQKNVLGDGTVRLHVASNK